MKNKQIFVSNNQQKVFLKHDEQEIDSLKRLSNQEKMFSYNSFAQIFHKTFVNIETSLMFRNTKIEKYYRQSNSMRFQIDFKILFKNELA